MPVPLLYTFRRCPYAMRARWAIRVAGVAVAQEEVSLRAKPPAMLAASPKGTVPVLLLPSGEVIDQSLDIMLWALRQRDPDGWLTPEGGTLPDMLTLIAACETDFKPHLDRFKYPSRYAAEWAGEKDEGALTGEQAFSDAHFRVAQSFLAGLGERLSAGESDEEKGGAAYLFGARPSLADFATVPFVRQMARHAPERFAAAAPSPLARWMGALLARADFEAIMVKSA